MNWLRVPNGGKVDIDAFKKLTKKGVDETFPYYTDEQREFIFNQIDDNKPIQRKSRDNKDKPDNMD